jgi:hypothetical protein
MKILAWLKAHASRHRELYLWVPLALALLVGAIHFVQGLSGRAVVDDPGAIVGWLYNAIAAVLVVTLAGQTKPHLFDDIDTSELLNRFFSPESAFKGPAAALLILGRILIDSCETVFLLCFFAWLVFR